MTSNCLSCHDMMESIWKDVVSEFFRCKRCGVEISINFDHNRIEVEKKEPDEALGD